MKHFYTFIFIVFITTISLGQSQDLKMDEGPMFNIKNREVKVVDATVNTTKIIKFPFVNYGTETLVFENKNSTCNCLATEIPDEVNPGEMGELKIHFTPKKLGSYNETIYIQTNANSKPVLLPFKAEVSQ